MEAMTTELQSMFDSLGLTELTGLMITITALSGSFYFIIGLARPLLVSLWQFVKRFCYREIETHSSDYRYDKFDAWLCSNKQYIIFQRRYKVSSSNQEGGTGDDKRPDLVTGYGSVLLKVPHLPLMWVTRTKDEAKQVFQQTEIIQFKLFSPWSSKNIYKFYDEVLSFGDDCGPFVFKSVNDWWKPLGPPKKVLSPLGNSSQKFLDDVDTFLANKDEYEARGIPHKRGYLLYGIPGTGKTSMIAYLAHKNNMNIYLVSSDTISNFESLMPLIKSRSIILIEDIDMTIAGEAQRDGLLESNKSDKSDKSDSGNANYPPTEPTTLVKMTVKEYMRTFLNTLDGISEFKGSIIVATTNKPDVLDSALLRPGRIDQLIEINSFGETEQIEHVNRFFRVELDPKDYVGIPRRTFAEIQFICILHMHDIDAVKQLLHDRVEV